MYLEWGCRCYDRRSHHRHFIFPNINSLSIFLLLQYDRETFSISIIITIIIIELMENSHKIYGIDFISNIKFSEIQQEIKNHERKRFLK